MYKLAAEKRSKRPACKSGVTLIEIMVVTVVIGLMAAISFPVFKIIQQREKERRLKDILLSVRAAIGGSKSFQSNKVFTQGCRNYFVTQGISKIKNAHTAPADQPLIKPSIQHFLKSSAAGGELYPLSPSHIIRATPYTVRVATDTTTGFVDITIQRRFLRTIPPHPFKGWYPNAHWEFKPALNTAPGGPYYASSTTDPWNSTPQLATGVTNIVSRGAGVAIDGSNTDDW